MRKLLSLLTAILFVGSMWATDPIVLFHETFGNNENKARDWSDSYSVKSGVSAVYSGITSYTVSNVKQGKNNTGYTLSGLNQSSKGTDAYIIIGPLSVASYESLNVTYQWKAASIKETYTTALYYKTSSGGIFTEVSGTGAGANSFVERSYSLPAAAQVATLYLKIVWNTSNTGAIIDEVELTGVEGAPAAVATPTFTPSTASFENSVNVSLACETDGASIYYTLDGTDPTSTSTLYETPFTLTDTTTVKAIAILGNESSSIASKIYTKFGPITCAEFAARANGVSALLGEVTVNYVSGKYTYVKDNTGVILLYDQNDKNLGLASGDIVNGIKGTVSIYNNLHEVIPSVTASDLTKTSGEAPNPIEFNDAPTSADVNKYVVLKDVTVESGEFVSGTTYTTLPLTIGGETITLRNTFGKDFTFVAGTHYNVVGTVAINNTTLQLYFISAEEKGCSNVVTITKGAETNGTYSLSAAEICGDDEGDMISILDITPATGYEFDEITTSASGTVDNENKRVTGITANTTITVKFKAIPTYTVSFSTGEGNPTVDAIEETLGGQGITLPAGPAPKCADWTFAGWAASAVAEATTTAPTLLAAGTNYKPASNVTLYAVYSKTVGASEHYGTITITYNSTNFPDAYANLAEYTLEGYNFKIQQIYKSGEKMQWRAKGNKNGTGFIYNTGVFPAKISSIVLTYDSSDSYKNHTLNVGDEENPSEGTAISGVTDGLVETFDCSSENADYFLLANGANAGYTSSIAINYGNAGTTTYISSPSCTPTAVDNVEVVGSAVKVLRNGILLIEKNGHTYNAMGQLVK